MFMEGFGGQEGAAPPGKDIGRQEGRTGWNKYKYLTISSRA